MGRTIMSIDFNKKENNSSFEITIQIRDKNGNPTGRTKTFGSDSCSETSNWFERQKPHKRKKKKRKKKEK